MKKSLFYCGRAFALAAALATTGCTLSTKGACAFYGVVNMIDQGRKSAFWEGCILGAAVSEARKKPLPTIDRPVRELHMD